MGGAFAFVLWAWNNNDKPLVVPTVWTNQQSSTGPGWVPRTIEELLGEDSRLTVAEIRALLKVLQPPPFYVAPLPPGPTPHLPLMITPNMLPVEPNEDAIKMLLIHGAL